MTPRYGYSATWGRGTPAKVTETMTADLVRPTPKVNRHFRATLQPHRKSLADQVRSLLRPTSRLHTTVARNDGEMQQVAHQERTGQWQDPSLSDDSVKPQSRQRCANSVLGLGPAEEVAHEVPHLTSNTNLMETNQSALHPRSVERFLDVHEGDERMSGTAGGEDVDERTDENIRAPSETTLTLIKWEEM